MGVGLGWVGLTLNLGRNAILPSCYLSSHFCRVLINPGRIGQTQWDGNTKIKVDATNTLYVVHVWGKIAKYASGVPKLF